MTRKHFVAIAKAINDLDSNEEGLNPLIKVLCSTFKDLNPAFDESRFKKACFSQTSCSRRGSNKV